MGPVTSPRRQMRRVIFSYSYLFYSFYSFYRTKEDFGKEWPQGWAVFGVSITIFCLFSAIGMESAEAWGDDVSYLPFLYESLPKPLGYGWIFVAIIVANGIIFLRKRAWYRVADRYDSLSSDTRQLNHRISLTFILLTFGWFFVRLFSL